MPRQPKKKKELISVTVNGVHLKVTLHPPAGARTSWYAYWTGLKTSQSTGQSDFTAAFHAVEGMLKNGGEKPLITDAHISDAEFEEIQRRHFGKRKDEKTQLRAAQSLKSCLEAISAFREITGLNPVTTASVADCERFQEEALKRPRNWRQVHPKSKAELQLISSNTVVKWSRELQAAFERSNKNAGRKCIRGVVPDQKLLEQNPWRQFTWIEGSKKAIRQFDSDELVQILDYFKANWPGVTVAPVLAKTFLWSMGRRSEITSLRWSDERCVGDEIHFHLIGKWGVERWFQIPAGLHDELKEIRADSPFVFASFNRQLVEFHEQSIPRNSVGLVKRDFVPENLGDWFYRQIVEWSKTLPNGHVSTHVFRKTSLQLARRGADINHEVARDACLTKSVMMTNYVREYDEEMRAASNRTFDRILKSLGPHLAVRYGYLVPSKSREELEIEHAQATAARDWGSAARIATELAKGWG